MPKIKAYTDTGVHCKTCSYIKVGLGNMAECRRFRSKLRPDTRRRTFSADACGCTERKPQHVWLTRQGDDGKPFFSDIQQKEITP